MKKRIFLALMILVAFLSTGVISASEISVNDSSIVDDSSNDVLSAVSADLGSYDSNNLSVNNMDNDLNENTLGASEDAVKKAVIIDAPDINLYYKNGTKLLASLSDIDGDKLVNQSIIFTISGINYTRLTNASGVASIAINLIPGTYNVSVSYGGSDTYLDSKVTSTINVFPTISGNNIVKYYRNGTQYYATFLDGSGNPLINTNITYNINGVFYTRSTNASGVARLNINLEPDTYILTAIHPVTNYMYSNNVTVYPTITSNDLTKIYRDGNQYYATFLDGSGNPLVNTNVTYNIHGVFYTRSTNASGVARLNINLLAGEYILTAYHPNDSYRLSNIITVLSSSTTSIEVQDSRYTTGDKKTISARLLNQLGYSIPNQKVVISVNNKDYSVETNDNGIASVDVDLTSGVYKVSYKYTGVNPYKSSTNTSTLTVSEAHNVSFIVNNTVIYYNNHESFDVTVVDEGNNAISNENLYFTINGKVYSRTTDNNGVAKININLSPGSYDISYKFNASNYQELSKSSKIVVIDANTSTLNSKNMAIGKGAGQKFTVTLTAGSVALENRSVIFNINGRNYTRTTDENGTAGLTINLNEGNYSIKYYYTGENRISASEGEAFITVVNRIATSISWNSATKFTTKTVSNLKVYLLDSYNNPINKAAVIFTVNSNEYNVSTASDGVASLDLTLAAGSYAVSYRYDGDNDYAPCEGVTTVSVENTASGGYGYWVQGKDMESVNLANLASLGTGNIFLNFYAFTLHGESKVLSWISQANSNGINVHIWMQSFYNGGWISPVVNGKYNQSLFTQKINEAKYYAGLTGVSGVHLDYLRFPGNAYKTSGGTAAITEFVKQITSAVKSVNSNIIVSAAVMPETSNDAYYYGQDIPAITQYLDVIVPMEYKGNYNAGTGWITSTTKWFVQNSKGSEVWSGLQTYKSDSDLTKLSANELIGDSQAALNGGAKGIVLFRWGVTNFIDFNRLDDPSYGGSVSISDVLEASTLLKEYIEDNGTLPSMVKVGSENYLTSQLLYMMSQAILAINNESSSDIAALLVTPPENSSGDVIYDKLLLDGYLKVARGIYQYITSNNEAPNNITSTVGDIKYESLLYMYSRVLAYYSINNNLPSFVLVNNLLDNYTLTVSMLPSYSNIYQNINYTTTWLNYCPSCGYYGTLLVNPKHTHEGELTCYYCDSDYCGVSGNEKVNGSKNVLTRLSESVPTYSGDIGENVTLTSIITAAKYLKEYISEHSDLPDSIVLAEGEYSLPQFLYLMSKAIVQLGNSNYDNISVINVSEAASPSGAVIDTYLSKTDYLDLAKRVADFILANGHAPNYASSTAGKVIYSELLDSFSRILDYYSQNNNTLPGNVHVVYTGSSSGSISALAASLIKGLTSEREKAVALYNYVRDKISYSFYFNTVKGAEGTLSSGSGNCCDQAWLLVAMARSVNLTVRFGTGYCTFTSGSTYGHVWVQFNIGGSWINADPTSSRNSFGVIKNWNTNSFTDRGTYDILPY